MFGGCNIILMGDLLQLKPCFGSCIFEKPSQYYTEVDLWSIFNMNVLWRNQRHIGDTAYGDLCSRMRGGEYTSADLNTLIERMNYYNINKDQFKESIHLCARRKTVAYYNKIGLEKVSLIQKVYRINCDDTYACGEKSGQKVIKKHLYTEESKCGGISDSIDICIGARVMLRRNKDISLGLVNGAMGTITVIQCPMLNQSQLNSGDLPDCVLIKFDDKEIAEKYHDKIGDSVIIKPITVNFDGKE